MDTTKLRKAAQGYPASRGGLNVQTIKEFLIQQEIKTEEQLKGLRRKELEEILLKFLNETEEKQNNFQTQKTIKLPQNPEKLTDLKGFCDLCLLADEQTTPQVECQQCQKKYCLNCSDGCAGRCAFCKDENLHLSAKKQLILQKEKQNKIREQEQKDRQLAEQLQQQIQQNHYYIDNSTEDIFRLLFEVILFETPEGVFMFS